MACGHLLNPIVNQTIPVSSYFGTKEKNHVMFCWYSVLLDYCYYFHDISYILILTVSHCFSILPELGVPWFTRHRPLLKGPKKRQRCSSRWDPSGKSRCNRPHRTCRHRGCGRNCPPCSWGRWPWDEIIVSNAWLLGWFHQWSDMCLK